MPIERNEIEQAIRGITRRFDRAYWLRCYKESRFTDELWRAMAEAGLLGAGIPEEYGGVGGGLTETSAVMDGLSRVGLAPLYLVITGLSRAAILKHGTEDQKRRYIPPTVSGEEKFCFAITEPNAGTNSFKIQTLAKETGKGTYKISGQKIFISGADVAEWILLVVRTTPYSQVKDRREGLALFIVDAKAPGIELNPLNIPMVCPERQFIVNFDEVEVPAENLVGKKDDGVRVLFDALNPERLLIAAMCLGIGDFALQKAVDYANTRAPFDEPIGSYQALQHPMAYAKAHLEASRLMLYRAAQVYDEGSVAGAESNMAKLLCTEAATEACEIALQVHGGYGFDMDYDILSLWSIARVMEVAPINNQMVLNFLGEKVLGLPKSYGRFRA